MKRLTLFLSMLIALVSYNANAAIYIVGSDPFGNWNPGNGVEMTDNGDGTYSYTTTVSNTVYFVFGDGLNSEWNVFNPNYRMGPTGGSDQVVNAGEWTTTQKAPNGSKSYKFTGSGGDYVFTFDATNMRFKVEGYVEPIVINTYSVAGEPASIFGAEWSDTNTATDMTLVDGLYTWGKEGVELTAGTTIKFKIVGNHDWGFAWPEEDVVRTIDETGIYDLKFTFDPATEEVGFTATKVQDGPEVNPLTGHLYIVGQVNNNGWNPSTAIEMTAGENNVFTLTDAVISDAEEGYGFFSFMSKLGENANDWPNDYRIGATENGYEVVSGTAAPLGEWNLSHDNAFKALAGYYDITVDLVAGTVLLVAKEAPQPTVDPVYIMGNVNGYTWDAIHGVEMNYDETANVYTAEINVTDANNGKGYFGFTKKLADPESETPWDDIAGYRFGPMCDPEAENWVLTEELLGTDCELDLEGSYKSIEIPAGTWTVTVDLNNGLFKINGTWPTDTVVPEVENVYIMGNVNDLTWDAISGVEMTYDAENEVYTAEINVTDANNGKGYFGFTKKLADPESETPWDDIAGYRFGPVCDPESENWVMTEELLGTECALATDGSYKSIEIPAGAWTVTVDMVNNVFTINGEWPVDTVTPEPYTGDIFIMGNVNDFTWDAISGVQMTYDAENEVYTAEINVADVNEGKGYFGFTKKLAEAESETPWDDIAAFRFGPVCDPESENWVLTEELIGVDCALATDGSYKSIEVAAGKWAVTVDMVHNTFNIKKAGMIGDVNSDNTVNITDVTILINAVMSENFSTINFDNSDMNGDGNINITDVTMLINAVMSM